MHLHFTLYSLYVLLCWMIAAAWWWKALTTAVGLRRVPDLLGPNPPLPPGELSLVVIVPARNEEETIEAGLRSLLRQDYGPFRVLAVDDRSTDRTGFLMNQLEGQYPDRLSVFKIYELPSGWLGKTHAMARAAEYAQQEWQPEWMLFTDADVQFAPDAVRRSVAAAIAGDADHFVTLPTPIVGDAGEAMMLGFLQVLSCWAVRLWRVTDPGSRRDSIGIGAFSLVRSSCYWAVGGFEALRMEILEDLYFGRLVKARGFHQRVGFGRDLIRVHWAKGANGIVGVLTKNLFSVFRFRLWLVLLASLWMAVFFLGPIVALGFPGSRLPAILTFAGMGVLYRIMGRQSGISAWTVLLSPAAAALLIFAVLRSTWKTLHEGGVRWRGTFYSLEELREWAGPLFTRRA